MLLRWLEENAKRDFQDMKTAESWVRTYGQVYDHRTGDRVKTVMWPATKKETTIPVARDLTDNTLAGFQFWVYDSFNGDAVITCDDVEYRICDPTNVTLCPGRGTYSDQSAQT